MPVSSLPKVQDVTAKVRSELDELALVHEGIAMGLIPIDELVHLVQVDIVAIRTGVTESIIGSLRTAQASTCCCCCCFAKDACPFSVHQLAALRVA